MSCKLSQAGLDQLSQIPAARGVFALLGDRDVPIALLTAADMRSRLKNRLAARAEEKRTRLADLRQVTKKILWKRTSSHFETDLCYLELAREYWPDTYADLLSWKSAWFVRVDTQDEFPHFSRTRRVQVGGKYVGPFISARAVERFVDALCDAFDLCRDIRSLRLAPHGQACSYAQMGRCPSPCNGSISMDEYRAMFARAADFAFGRQSDFREELEREMRQAAGKLQFERAAELKSRIDRLKLFDSGDYAYLAPLEQFRFIIIQPGGSKRKAEVFLVNAGRVSPVGKVNYPLKEKRLQAVLCLMKTQSETNCEFNKADLLRMGLVTRYLFSAPRRKGLILRWNPDMTVADLTRNIEASKTTKD